MKRTLKSILTFGVILWLQLPSTADSNETSQETGMFEPLLGISYAPSKVEFERAPKEILRCEDLKVPRRKLFLFGRAYNKENTFYYVHGLVEVDFGAGPTGEFEAENGDGMIVVLSPGKCRHVGAGYALSPNPKQRKKAHDIGVTDDVLSALLSDVVSREVKAFGGASKFLAKVKATGIKDTDLNPQVRAKLDALRKKERESSTW